MVKRRRRKVSPRKIYRSGQDSSPFIRIISIVGILLIITASVYYGYPYVSGWFGGTSSSEEGGMLSGDVPAEEDQKNSGDDTKKAPPKEVTEVQLKNYQIEVLNGSGKQGLASRTTDSLRAHGFDVVKTGNFESRDISNTFVMIRSTNERAAKMVAEYMGIGSDYILLQRSPDLMLDATVVLGLDIFNLKMYRKK